MLKNRTQIRKQPVKAGKAITLQLPVLNLRSFRLKGLALLIIFSNMGTHYLLNPRFPGKKTPAERLYLLGEAQKFISDIDAFETKVRLISKNLQVPPEWLMAVMFSESGFDSSVLNHKGSGAVGLIQFMPVTAGELKVSHQTLADMNPVAQLDYVEQYFVQVRERYGAYVSLTDLYLAVLYPQARGQEDYCFALYASPAKAYQQNKGLDENRDGVVTVSDIDRRMKRLFEVAYHKTPAMQ
ncbi:MAG: transglycosylase SLT domain-containing protein [Bacteroidia bacterium]|nr:transglycosylase SLT domain-containing protein [Bacteroidia bacterium]